MNSVEEVVFSELPEAVTSSVYWMEAPKNAALPYVVFFQTNDAHAKVMLSHYGGQARVQFNVYAHKPSDAVNLRREVKDAVRNIRGLFGGVFIVNSEVTNEVTQGLMGDRHYASVIDVIFHWEDRR